MDGSGFHGAWVTTVVGLCETKTANQIALCYTEREKEWKRCKEL